MQKRLQCKKHTVKNIHNITVLFLQLRLFIIITPDIYFIISLPSWTKNKFLNGRGGAIRKWHSRPRSGT